MFKTLFVIAASAGTIGVAAGLAGFAATGEAIKPWPGGFEQKQDIPGHKFSFTSAALAADLRGPISIKNRDEQYMDRLAEIEAQTDSWTAWFKAHTPKDAEQERLDGLFKRYLGAVPAQPTTALERCDYDFSVSWVKAVDANNGSYKYETMASDPVVVEAGEVHKNCVRQAKAETAQNTTPQPNP